MTYEEMEKELGTLWDELDALYTRETRLTHTVGYWNDEAMLRDRYPRAPLIDDEDPETNERLAATELKEVEVLIKTKELRQRFLHIQMDKLDNEA